MFYTNAGESLSNARYNNALANAAFLVDAIGRADFENPLFEQNLIQFVSKGFSTLSGCSCLLFRA